MLLKIPNFLLISFWFINLFSWNSLVILWFIHFMIFLFAAYWVAVRALTVISILMMIISLIIEIVIVVQKSLRKKGVLWITFLAQVLAGKEIFYKSVFDWDYCISLWLSACYIFCIAKRFNGIIARIKVSTDVSYNHRP